MEFPNRMIFPPFNTCNIPIRDILIPLGWFASATVGFWFASYLDRRRAINGVLSQIEIIRDSVAASEDAEVSYNENFEDLKKAVFSSVPLFPKRMQKKIIRAWTAYRSLDFRQMRDKDFVSSVMSGLGHPITFKHEAVLKALSEVEKHIK